MILGENTQFLSVKCMLCKIDLCKKYLNIILFFLINNILSSDVGSPFTCQVSEAARVVISGDGLEKVAVNRAAMFCVEADPSLGRPDVQVLSPSRRPLTVDVGVQTAGGYIVHFTPTDVG